MKTLGQIAYEAYEAAQGFPNSLYAELDTESKTGWEAAADAVLACGWQPVADGEYKCDCSAFECTHTFEIEADGIFFTAKADGDAITVDLGGRMVCKR